MKPLYGMSGKAYQLDSSPIGSGGEGNIYRLINDNGQVAKIYHSSNRSLEIEQKLIFMVKKPPSSRVMSQVAWPLDILYDSQQKFCGFIMPKLSITDELQVLYQYPPQKYKNLTTKQKIIVAENICAVISDIHKAGYVFGDFNPRNIGIDIKTGRVAFLDTDTYHIVLDKSNNKAYRCIVCLDGYVAPELLTKIDMEKINKDAYALASLDTFTKETDYFALAIHLFKLLMNGYTPFNGIKEVDSASQASPGVGNVAIRRDNYCFKPGNKPQSPAVPPVDTLPKEIAELFTRAFIYGRIDPKQRPSALEWHGALVQYENSLKNCAQNPAHQYYKTLTSCPWCDADARYNNATAPSLAQKSYGAPPVLTPPHVLTPPSPVNSPLQNLQPQYNKQSQPQSYSAGQRLQTSHKKSQLKTVSIAMAVSIALIFVITSLVHNASSNSKQEAGATSDSPIINRETQELIEGSIVAFEDGWIYYEIGPDYRTELYKMRPDGTDSVKLLDEIKYFREIEGDWIYYNKPHNLGGGDFFRIKTDGTQQTEIPIERGAEQYDVVGNWIYYADYHGLKKIQTDGTAYTLIKDLSCYNLKVVDEWIYFLNSYKLYKIRTNGSDLTELLGENQNSQLNSVGDDDMFIKDGWVYSIASIGFHNYQIFKVMIDGSSFTQLTNVEEVWGVLSFDIAGNRIFYNAGEPTTYSYMMNIDGSGLKKLNFTVQDHVFSDGIWIYYTDEDGIMYRSLIESL